MIIKDASNLTCNLVPLEDLEVTLENRYMISLKSNFNEKEVKQYLRYMAVRLFHYQFGVFYEYKCPIEESDIVISSELLTSFENRINESVDDFYRFKCQIKTSGKNMLPEINKGDAEYEFDWSFTMNFINIYELKNVGYVNTEDLSYDQEEACFFGRSMGAIFMQNFCKQFPEIVSRNFTILKLEAEENKESADKILKLQRDVCLTREAAIDNLQGVKGKLNGFEFKELLTKEFTGVK